MKDGSFNFLRWAPVVVSMVLMVMIAIGSVATVAELKKDTYWREHTFQVILDAQTFEDKLVDAQDSVRDYAGRGKSNLLIEYKNDTNVDLQEFNQLTNLTSDNPEQEQRLRDLSAAVKAIFDNDNKVIGVYARQGSQSALQVEETPTNEDTTERAIGDLEQFTDGEKALLNKRDASEQKDYHRAAHLLVLGSVIAAGLLILSNFLASREMARRRRAETEQRELIDRLQKALTEVKTLSGLIPICGWCKSVRNDTGYWQTVEHYMKAHTDATFTHSICPACREKFKAEIAQVNGGSKN
jgi:CHASE3 domain sensor protein